MVDAPAARAGIPPVVPVGLAGPPGYPPLMTVDPVPAEIPASTADPAAISRRLLAWFEVNGRGLDVRSTTDPWSVLVIEVMSQQTQIRRVDERWRQFVARWPNPAALASATTTDLLRSWAGLGYNRRAVALREAARRIVRDHGGQVPGTIEELRSLPGIGPYTARAVAAAAFGVAAAPLDVNVRRVVGRLVGATDGLSPRAFQTAADGLLRTTTEPRRWVHAAMDLAVDVCRPRHPRCGECPIAFGCASRGTSGSRAADLRRARPAGFAGPARFPATRRWLRGRIVAALREVDAGAWVTFDEPIGVHGLAAIHETLATLDGEGIVERREGSARLR